MIFDVILENDINYNEVLKKTKKYMKCNYNSEVARSVFMGCKGSFYAMVEPYGIKFDIVANYDMSISEIEGYLQYLFKRRRLIILCKEKIILGDLNCLYLNGV